MYVANSVVISGVKVSGFNLLGTTDTISATNLMVIHQAATELTYKYQPNVIKCGGAGGNFTRSPK